MDNIRIIFVLSEKYSEEGEASEIMQQAFEACKQNLTINVTWIKETNFDSVKLGKTDFVVFEDFNGKQFETLRATKCARILGPWAVSICLMDGKSIPNFPWPIYNVAMYDCIVTCSHLSKSIKMDIKEKVELMGGCYVDTLLTKNTHLITGSAKSEKYLTAAESGVPLMRPSWVEDVWQVSQTVNVHANDKRFEKHRCLPFQDLTITSTGVTSAAERKRIEKLVTDNGGKFTGNLALSSTDILICCGDATTSTEKYKAARQQGHIKCVKLAWLTDSIEKGYALPHNSYQVQKVTSTPTKPEDQVNPEFSMLSAIGGPNISQRGWVEDSMASLNSPAQRMLASAKRKANSKEDYGDLVEKLDIKRAKRAGQYLDGCSVYITGFSPEHAEKLTKILNLSGATRYDNFSDRVTHVIVGDPTFHEVKLIKMKGFSSLLVSVHWLLDCIEQEQPVNESKYLLGCSDVERSELGSPLSKKGLNLLRSSRLVTEKEIEVSAKKSLIVEEVMDEEVRQYLRPSNTSTQEDDTLAKLLEGVEHPNFSNKIKELPKTVSPFQPAEMPAEQSSVSVTQDGIDEVSRIFQNLKFSIIGFDEDYYSELKEKIEGFSGEVVPKSYKGVPDYAVLPIFNNAELHQPASEVINDLFIFDCEREEQLTEILYYHRPFAMPNAKPLKNCVITTSIYTGQERVFLRTLIEMLGGVSQEQFARVKSEAKGVVASTHLVIAEPTGKKYEAALKWNLPVVTKDWLLECVNSGRRVSEAEYLLGTSKAPERTEDISPKKIPEERGSFSDSSKNSCVTSVGTPGSSKDENRISTPDNQKTPAYKKYLYSAEKPFSQVTPVNKIMKHFRESNMDTLPSAKNTKEYTVPQPWMNIKTPDTPLGACLTPDPSPGLRKQWEYWLRQFPDKPSPKSNASTPMAEIKRQLWNKVCSGTQQPNFNESQEEVKLEEGVERVNSTQEKETTPEKTQLASRLQQLEEMVSASGGGKRQSRNFQSTIPGPAGNSEFKDSQPCTVGWDFRDQEEPKKRQIRIFSVSGIANEEERSNVVRQLENLGASVSNLVNYDPTCTHLLCPKPARNEKSLSCMAAGKWVLHISYLEKSVEAGYFLNEEEFEFGNPKAVGKFKVPNDRDTEMRMSKMYWWRREVSRRGYGAFNDMRAIVVAHKREPIVRVIEAGGGVVIDLKPPFDDTVHATHCLLEQKSVQDFAEYVPLALQGVYLVNTVFISDFLHQPDKDIRDGILPYFAKYYSRS